MGALQSHRLGLATRMVLGAIVASGLSAEDDARTPTFLKIVSERQVSSATTPPAVRTEYIQRDRRREEIPGFGDVVVTITRCDLGQRFMISTNRHEYSATKLSTLGREVHPTPGLVGSGTPKLLVEVTTLDTGEKQQGLGYTARHVVVTRKEIPLPGSRSLPAEVRSDGWYIDLNPANSCPGMFSEGASLETLLNTNLLGTPLDEVTLRYVGPKETGFAIEERRTYRRQLLQPGGSRSENTSVWSMRVTELSTVPHDRALFEIPRGFHRIADAYQDARPSIFTRLLNGWYWFWNLILGPR